jgi:hypothetical protein
MDPSAGKLQLNIVFGVGADEALKKIAFNDNTF